jgi:hypothetical protein
LDIFNRKAAVDFTVADSNTMGTPNYSHKMTNRKL